MKRNFLIELRLRLGSITQKGRAWITKVFGRKKHNLKARIASGNLPEHIAVIMDGNGRWATRQGEPRVLGHKNALKAVREVIEACGELGVSYLTLFAFSTENWARPQVEVDYLMGLITKVLDKELGKPMAFSKRGYAARCSIGVWVKEGVKSKCFLCNEE